MGIAQNLGGIFSDIKASMLGAVGIPTDGRVQLFHPEDGPINLPAREGLAVLQTGNPDYTAYFTPLASTGSGMGGVSFSTVDALMNNQINPPPRFRIVTVDDGVKQTLAVSADVVRSYCEVVAEMVRASENGRLEQLPDLSSFISQDT